MPMPSAHMMQQQMQSNVHAKQVSVILDLLPVSFAKVREHQIFDGRKIVFIPLQIVAW